MQNNNTAEIKNLELFYTKKFSNEEIEDLCFEIAQTVLEKYFLSGTFTNAIYEKEIFKVVKNLIIMDLNNSFNNDLEFHLLLSVYIFKKNFKIIFQYLSELIMEEVAFSNTIIIDFLKYYSLQTLVVDNKKYDVPNIQEDDGPIWNVTSMLSILKTYVKTQKQVDIIEDDIKIVRHKIQSYYIDNISPVEHNQMVEKKYLDLEDQISQNASDINIIHDSLRILKDSEEIEAANYELEVAQKQRIELRDEKAELIKIKVKQYKMFEYEALIKQQEKLLREIKPKHKIIEQNQSSYLSIKRALTKALISKKQAI